MRIRRKTVMVCGVFLVAISMSFGRVQAEGPAFKAVHLLNVPSGAAEVALLGALDELNQAVAKEGYSQIRYRLWKVQGEQQGSQAYLWESTWPDRTVYTKVHQGQAWQRALERVRSVIEASKDHVYNQYAEVVAAKATK